MNSIQCKRLLDEGILQAFAEGKSIQYLAEPGKWIDIETIPRVLSCDRYRVKPVKKVGWINVYLDFVGGAYVKGPAWKTKEEADLGQSLHLRIACIQIEYEEGEGL